jgi:hypothetical protein
MNFKNKGFKNINYKKKNLGFLIKLINLVDRVQLIYDLKDNPIASPFY